MDQRPAILANAHWGVANEPQIHYTEDGRRMSDLLTPRHLPMEADCTSSIDCWFHWAGCPAPGIWTGDMLGNPKNKRITLAQVQPTDIIIYGPGTGWHAALVIEGGTDPLTISHGREAGPMLMRVSQDGRHPQTYLRPITDDGKAPPKPVKNKQEFLAGMTWVHDLKAHGDWLVYKGRKAGFPSGVELAAAKAHKVKEQVLNPQQIAHLVPVPWGKL